MAKILSLFWGKEVANVYPQVRIVTTYHKGYELYTKSV